jgi:glyoxylase-like metal-dependent hydrolase (beta-lactamase superfamily II)
MDYHGYMGNWRYLCASLEKILAQKPDMLIPSHGGVIRNPKESASLLIRKLSALYGNYASISSMNHYFPGFFDGKADLGARMKPAATFDFPEFIRSVGYTSSLILSETGDGLLVDCGNDVVIDNLRGLQGEGVLKSLDDCWVTHYHDDHADALDKLEKAFHCSILITSVMKDVLENPEKYRLPCLSPVSINAKGLEHGHQWRWNEFILTALHFPGQTFYHGGLLVEKQGVKVLFGGDSFSPAGIDDYCSGNRNFSGKERGFRYCIDLIRDIRPDFIINQHQDKAFRFSDEELDCMDRTLAARERLLSALMPWDNPDFGTDESWVCAYPYWQTASPGSEITVEVRFTNHGDRWVEASAAPILPDGWNLAGGTGNGSCTGEESGAEMDCVTGKEGGTGYESVMIPSRKEGPSPALSDHDGSICMKLSIPEDALGETVVIPLRICWDGMYLGQFRHALVQIV